MSMFQKPSFLLRNAIICLFALLSCSTMDAQINLVLNPSFEDTAHMTFGTPYLITANWWNPNGANADYFTPLSAEFDPSTPISGAILHAPMSEGLGYQLAQDGGAYVGMVTAQSTGETRDYVQGFLSQPLEGGETYCVSFWLAMSDSSGLQSCDYHVAFTNSLIYQDDSGNMNLPNAIHFDIASIDGVSWTYFSDLYTALGGEQYIYLGSQSDNAELDCIVPFSAAWLWNEAYVLLDNVSVVKSSECTLGIAKASGSDGVTLFPNPASNWIEIRSDSANDCQFRLYSMSGEMLLNQIEVKEGQHIDLTGIAPGIYIGEVSTSKAIFRNRLVIE
jgi:hypothetical protein